MAKIKAIISATGLYTPKYSVSNDQLVEAFNQYVDLFNKQNHVAIETGHEQALTYSSSEFIEKASGITSRYFIAKDGIVDPSIMAPRLAERDDDEPSILAEMAINAAKDALGKADRDIEEIDLIIVACSNLQRAYPAISVEVQHYLGAKGFAYDMNVACSSATFGIKAAADAVIAGTAKSVLVISPEVCSGHLNFTDRDSHFIFGDAATAVLVENESKSESGYNIIDARCITQYSNNIRNNFGFLNRLSPETRDNKDKLFRQQGRKVFKEVTPMVSALISSHLEEKGINKDGLKRLWLHQANLSMNQYISKKVLGKDFSTDKSPVILDEYGNTSSAGSIIAFHKHSDDLQQGDVGVICSFGAGYSAGSVILEKR
ncbi:MAG: beta-ketoacyl-ACP synthase III [Gammaproteobacteria bacterium]|nr:MAG: beta-ketoacyl-ACP synthase III [Gammaproteobacteria bacterium]